MNTASLFTSLRVAAWLLWCDIQLILKDWWNNTLNSIFWPVILILANGYVLPKMGMPADYGAFVAISMLIIMASFTAWGAANVLAADFETTRSINYELTLPLPYWMIYVKLILAFAFKAALFSLMSLLVGKLILLDAFSFANFNPLTFTIIYCIACIFFGAFAVWAASLAGAVDKFMNLELRITGPLFFICGYSFSWAVLYGISPIMGMLMLFTPWIYAYEGVRVAILGPAGYLNYWLCLLALIIFIALFIAHGLWLFKKRLDCI